MKKILFIAMMLLVSISLCSEKVNLTAVNARCTNGEWQGWQTCNIEADWDVTKQTMVIYSKIPQEFSQLYFDSKANGDSIVLISHAKDKYNLDVIVTMYFYKSTQYIKFSYPIGEYVYAIQ